MFLLNSNDSTPLYKQLYNQIREHTLSGRLHADSKIPSVRDLADELAISRNTVEGAYQELYAEGYIYSKPRSGYFISALDHDSTPLTSQHQFTKQPSVAAIDYVYDFHPAQLDPVSFPAILWRKCFVESMPDWAKNTAAYSDPQGESRLRQSLKKYLERSRGVLCEPEQIIICAGLQQSLDIVARLLQHNHSNIATEEPGYHLPRAVFNNHNYKVKPINVGAHGLDLDELANSPCTLAYITPSHQMPMGYVMPVANRLKLIEWADSGGKFILEDDYDSELRYSGKPIPSLHGLRPNGNIIYMGTFSKVLSPALRISYIVLPKCLLTEYQLMFKDYFSAVSLLEQLTLATFMENGHWERHVRRMRILYRKKHDLLLAAIERHFGNSAYIIGQGAGLHIVLQLPGCKLSETDVINMAQQKGIQLLPFSIFTTTDKYEPLKLIIGFGGIKTNEINQGIATLSRIFS